MSWHLIAYGSLHTIVKLHKSGLICHHKLNFNGLFVAFKDGASSLVSQAHPGFRTCLVALGFAWLFNLAFVETFKIESSETSSLQKEYTKVIKPYTGFQGWTALS